MAESRFPPKSGVWRLNSNDRSPAGRSPKRPAGVDPKRSCDRMTRQPESGNPAFLSEPTIDCLPVATLQLQLKGTLQRLDRPADSGMISLG